MSNFLNFLNFITKICNLFLLFVLAIFNHKIETYKLYLIFVLKTSKNLINGNLPSFETLCVFIVVLTYLCSAIFFILVLLWRLMESIKNYFSNNDKENIEKESPCPTLFYYRHPRPIVLYNLFNQNPVNQRRSSPSIYPYNPPIVTTTISSPSITTTINSLISQISSPSVIKTISSPSITTTINSLISQTSSLIKSSMCSTKCKLSKD